MKQRISVMAAAITLAVTLAACGTNTEDADRTGPSRPTATATEKSGPTDPVTEAHNDADTNLRPKDDFPQRRRQSILSSILMCAQTTGCEVRG